MSTFVGALTVAAIAFALGCRKAPQPAKTTPPQSVPNAQAVVKEAPPAEPIPPQIAVASDQQGWGTIRGRFVYEGNPPAQTKIRIDKDVEFCSQTPLLDESLIVDPVNKGIANVVLMLNVEKGDVPIHRSYRDPDEIKVAMNTQGCRFEPHVQFARIGSEVTFGNNDDLGHNPKFDTRYSPTVATNIASGEAVIYRPRKEEPLPMPVNCTIHSWMRSYLIVKDHPYVAISAADGSFELKHVPASEWEFIIWHEKAGYLKQLKAGGKAGTLQRGRWKVNIVDGNGNAAENAFGDLVVPASNFELQQ